MCVTVCLASRSGTGDAKELDKEVYKELHKLVGVLIGKLIRRLIRRHVCYTSYVGNACCQHDVQEFVYR